MQLLVSVRNAAEASRAVAGGADIVDAKDPASGAIAPVLPAELAAIRAAVPADLRLSAALGDVGTAHEVAATFARVSLPVAFVKLGFRGISDRRQIRSLLGAAVGRSRMLSSAPRVIAVAYADYRRAESLAPAGFPDLLFEAGADGLLVDTCFKDGGNLFAVVGSADLTSLGRALAREELVFALGGSLAAEDVWSARETGADILGVRGAACRQGRGGEVDETLVRRLVEAVRSTGRERPVNR